MIFKLRFRVALAPMSTLSNRIRININITINIMIKNNLSIRIPAIQLHNHFFSKRANRNNQRKNQKLSHHQILSIL